MADKKQLLLVLDEGYVIDRVQDILQNFPNFQVTLVESAKQARELLGLKSFDTVIADIYLRGASGLELLHKAKEKNKDVCVIIIAGAGDTELAAKAVKEGAFDFLIKPPGLDRLSNILKLISLVKI